MGDGLLPFLVVFCHVIMYSLFYSTSILLTGFKIFINSMLYEYMYINVFDTLIPQIIYNIHSFYNKDEERLA